MREILFRGKEVDTGEWVEGWYQRYPFGRWPLEDAIVPAKMAEEGCCRHARVDPETVGQFTGLTDMNGKKIFEGDILNSPSWWWGPRFVYLMQGECGPCHGENVMQYILAKNVDNPEHNATHNLWDGCEVEIIGNIHDNPELLTEKEE